MTRSIDGLICFQDIRVQQRTIYRKETTIQVSRETLCDKFDLSNAFLDKYECSATLVQDIGNQRKWYVYFVTIEKPTQANVQYQVTLDAQTSEIFFCEKN